MRRGAIDVASQELMVPLLSMSMAIARGSVEPPTAWKEVVAEGMEQFIPPRLWRGAIYKKEVRGRRRAPALATLGASLTPHLTPHLSPRALHAVGVGSDRGHTQAR